MTICYKHLCHCINCLCESLRQLTSIILWTDVPMTQVPKFILLGITSTNIGLALANKAIVVVPVKDNEKYGKCTRI